MNYNPLHLLPLPPQSVDPKPISTALTVDPFSDVLWIGTSSGSVSALCTPLSLTRNVQFPAHGARSVGPYLPHQGMSPAVKEIRVTDRDVWTLTEGGVGGRKRGGASKWNVGDPTRSLQSMTPNPTNSHEVLAGGSGQMLLANTSRGEVVRRIEAQSPVVHLAPLHRTVLSAGMSGQVTVLDPRTGFKAAAGMGSVQAHTGGLSGADVQGNMVCTWGWTHMQGHPLPDPLVRIYDVRTLRPLPPISFPAGPAFALLHPTDTSKLVLSSQQGMLQIIDMSIGSTTSSSSLNFQQLDVNSYVTSMALSPRGDYLAFGDADGQLHLWTTHEVGENAVLDDRGGLVLPPFNGYEGIKPEWPDAADAPPPIPWDDTTPLNLIGMPYYNEPLLSNFSPETYATSTSPFYNPPATIPNSVLSTVKMVDFVGYATNPKELRGKRYVLTARPGAGKKTTGGNGVGGGRRDSEPRFRSEKDKKSARAEEQADLEEVTPDGEIPKYYRKVEIKYSKFGIEDFDFEFYNRTKYSGLETDILNSYTNSLLQALHYIQPIRAVATAHICVDCKKEHCLLCEAGFLFRMLEDAKGRNCQASNFSRAFSATPQASALGLMDDNDKSTAPYGSLIQNFNRWLLSTFSTEAVVEGETFDLRPQTTEIDGLSIQDQKPSAIDQVLGIQTKTTNTCRSCGFVSSRDTTLHAVDLIYPRKSSTHPTFSEIVRSSIFRESTTKAVCSNCKQFAPLESRRVLSQTTKNPLPPVISINAMMNTADVFEVWKDRSEGSTKKYFLPPRLGVDEMLGGESKGLDQAVYEVRSMVVQVQERADTPAHLVSFIKIPNKEDENDQSSWIMFNDFLVRKVTEEEVFRFPDQWKVPAVIILERSDSGTVLELGKLPKQLNAEALFKDVSIAWNRRTNMIKHKVLQPEEMPKPGTLVAIDAEFVALQQEEMEFRSDGTKNILRPSHMSLARVSVLRGEGALEGKPFIDDYIHTSEAVVDYLTEYSGIKAGDLDPNNSPHTLVPLKVAYKKLRLLVDLGCIFIGHGLSKDFRTINIYIPPEQVMDTVNIYTIPGRQRKLSLRYLAWYLLKKDIQTHSHDSIEDARYALLLFKLWRDYENEGDGVFESIMDDVFNEGHKVGFKPPSAVVDRSASPAGNFPPLAQGKNGGKKKGGGKEKKDEDKEKRGHLMVPPSTWNGNGGQSGNGGPGSGRRW
ncbi:PAB-dependent poly(A)-specific ribonuclease subunit PAN2 [Kwoniella shandongensis]|uniref:PAN2-PAN3 deadenylation complex catalytic subunit PAN2 n=1 Tax=Kwoniella shandongensis TaxID=1734106 RepID=A0A5M6C5W6_9TREE|nr:PAB-dependent poly(A)-specific ribonuclease subunit PAN2 [Kwoniella shandongensis]KAA5528865.1 PAB-dependent poly(A)-specific ribonuclease subunit PAN2 [Kwoniella shandongensis]